MDPLRNPFSILQLRATANTRTVRRRLDELAVQLELGVTQDAIALEDLPWVRHQLDDPVLRLEHEALWVHGVDPIRPTDSAALATALGSLKGRIQAARTVEQTVALHDMAVLALIGGIETRDVGLVDEGLAAWQQTIEGDTFWGYLERRAVETQDVRATPETIRQIRQQAPSLLLSAVSSLSSQLVAAGDLGSAAAVVRSLRASGFPQDVVNRAVVDSLALLRQQIIDGATELDRTLSDLPRSGTPNPTQRTLLEQLPERGAAQVYRPAKALAEVDPNVSGHSDVLDRGAESLRSASVAACNLLEDWRRGWLLVDQAFDIARSPVLLSRLAADQAVVLRNLHHAELQSAVASDRYLDVAARASLLSSYADDPDEREAMRRMSLAALTREASTPERLKVEQDKIEHELAALSATVKERVPAQDSPSDRATVAPDPRQPPRRVRAGSPTEPGKGRKRRWWLPLAAIVVVVVVAGASAAAFALTSGNSSSTESSASAQPADEQGHASSTEEQPKSSPAKSEESTSETKAPPRTSSAPSSSAPSGDCDRLYALERRIDELKAAYEGRNAQYKRISAQIRPLRAELEQLRADYPNGAHQM